MADRIRSPAQSFLARQRASAPRRFRSSTAVAPTFPAFPRSSSHGETIYYTSPTGPAAFWTKSGQAEEEQDRASVADKYPFIVPPILDKTPLMTHESIRSIWAEAAQALVNTNQLFAIGYSLPKSDSALGYFLKNNLNSEASVEVVSKSADLVKRFEEALPKHKGKIAQNFSGDNAVLDFVAALKA